MKKQEVKSLIGVFKGKFYNHEMKKSFLTS